MPPRWLCWLSALPRPAVYFTGTVLFLFTIGACYALFTAVALEFLGGSGKSGSARYSIINSLGNLPVAYMAYLDGRSYAHWGPRAMPAADAFSAPPQLRSCWRISSSASATNNRTSGTAGIAAPQCRAPSIASQYFLL